MEIAAFYVSIFSLLIAAAALFFSFKMRPRPYWKFEKIHKEKDVLHPEDCFFVIRIKNVGNGPAHDVKVCSSSGRSPIWQMFTEDERFKEDSRINHSIDEIKRSGLVNPNEYMVFWVPGKLEKVDSLPGFSEVVDAEGETVTITWRQPPFLKRLKKQTKSTKGIDWDS